MVRSEKVAYLNRKSKRLHCFPVLILWGSMNALEIGRILSFSQSRFRENLQL
jgi:hypothetical protein